MKPLFTLFITAIAFVACNAQSGEVESLSQQDLPSMLQDENLILIDVRTSTEIASGYIPEVDHFIDINEANFEQNIAKLDTTKTYVLYCRSGSRSSRAASYMLKNGFSKVYNLEGGFLSYSGELKK